MRKILILFSIFVLTGLFAFAQNDLKATNMDKSCRELILVYTGADYENDCELINAFIRKLSKDSEQQESLPNICLTILGGEVCTELFTKLINSGKCTEDTQNALKILLAVNNSNLNYKVDTLYQPKNVPYKFWMDYKKIQRTNKPIKIK